MVDRGLAESLSSIRERLMLLERARARGASAAPGGSGTGVPAGTVLPWSGTSLPAGSVWARGQALSRTTYATLFAAIGTAWGAGDGSSTFNVPDMRGRVPAGRDASQVEFDTVGETGGAKTHVLSTAEIPPHSHAQRVTANTGGPISGRLDWGGDSGTMNEYPQNVTTYETGGGAAHNNLQPYAVVEYIITTAQLDLPGDSLLSSRVGALESAVTIPDPLTRYGNDTAAVTGAEVLWHDIPGMASATFGVLPRPLWVRFDFNASTLTTNSSTYGMIGVDCAGGLALAPEADQGGKNPAFGLTPFSLLAANNWISGTKTVLLPAGAQTTFRLRMRKNANLSNPAINYSKLEALPLRWGA